jgi:5-methylcytosine-specific restriction endonuclease McrA
MRKKDLTPKVCEECGRIYIPREKEHPIQFLRRRFCGNACKMKALSKFNTGKKAHNSDQQKRVCKWCGKEEKVASAYAKRPYCSRKCMQAHYASGIHRRENHWNWQGGITEDRSRDSLYPGYKEWRRAVFKRDNFTCQKCGCKKSGILVAHHIIPRTQNPDLLLDVSNGITFCNECHKEVHYGK